MTIIRSTPTTPASFRSPTPTRTDERQQFQQVCQTLLQHFNEAGGFSFFGNGTIDQNELYAAAQGQRGGPDVQAAAQWLLQHPQYVQELDTRGKATPDGKISQKDLVLELGQLSREQQLDSLRFDPRLPEFQQSLQTLQQYLPLLDRAGGGFGSLLGPDGKFSQKDLNAVITGQQYPPQLRQAAFFLSMNPDLASVLDTAAKGGRADGVVSANDLGTLINQLSGIRSELPQQTLPQYMTAQY